MLNRMSQAKHVDKVQTLSSEEVLKCSLCYERYDDNKRCPRLLNCGHTFCFCCLEQLLKGGTITCPQDRTNVPVTAGVGGLSKNFALLDVLLASSHKQPDATPPLCDTCGDEGHPATSCCLECKENMCEVAAQFHTRHKLSRDHRVVSLAEYKANPHLSAIAVFCPEHHEPFRYFDKDCGQAICRDCQALEHNGHKCCSLAEASAQSRQELEALTFKAKATAVQLKEAEERVMTVVSDLNRKKKHEEAKIHAVFDELRATLAAREQALVTEVSQLHKAKLFTLTEQCDLLRPFRACLLSAVDRAVTAIQSAGEVQLLVAKSDIATTLVATESQPPILEPQTDAELEFTINRKLLLGVLAKAGKVNDKSTYANTTSASGSGLEKAYPGQEASFIITARDRQGKPRALGGDPFVVVLQGDKGEKVDVKLADNKNGTYSATYTVPVDIKGELQLSVSFHGIHIQGSPYNIDTRALRYIGVADWYQNCQPYIEQWRLMDEACAALPGAPPGSRVATWQEYVERKIVGLSKFARHDYILLAGPGSEGVQDYRHCMKVVVPGQPLDGTFTRDDFCNGTRQAICVAYTKRQLRPLMLALHCKGTCH